MSLKPGAFCITNNQCESGKCNIPPFRCADNNDATKKADGSFCLPGANECQTNSYCGGLPVQCRPKQVPGTNCLTDSVCQSGKCVQGIFKCGDVNGKVPDGTFCDVAADQCQPNSYCGGVPVQCRPRQSGVEGFWGNDTFSNLLKIALIVLVILVVIWIFTSFNKEEIVLGVDTPGAYTASPSPAGDFSLA